MGSLLACNELPILLKCCNRTENIFDLRVEGFIAHVRSRKLACRLAKDSFHPKRKLLGLHFSNLFALPCHLNKTLSLKKCFSGFLLYLFFFITMLRNKSICVVQLLLSNC